jgi:hypothetical protein
VGSADHAGRIYGALKNAALPVAPGGRLFISIYNDQAAWSRRWRHIKRTYNRLPHLQTPFVVLVMGPRELRSALVATLRRRPQLYVRSWTDYKKWRGMSRWHDLVDWCGGYPFEVAKPEEIFDFCRPRGFRLDHLLACGGGPGCNQFVFTRER